VKAETLELFKILQAPDDPNPLIMLRELHQTQTLRDLTSLKFVFVPVQNPLQQAVSEWWQIRKRRRRRSDAKPSRVVPNSNRLATTQRTVESFQEHAFAVRAAETTSSNAHSSP
jgi:hypothetical protein